MNSSIRVETVKSRRLLMDFIRLPWAVNVGDPYWVPPLIRDRLKLLDTAKNPFFRHNPVEFFIVYKDNEPAGRVAAIVNREHNRLYNDHTGFFGFFDAKCDRQIFETVLRASEDWLKRFGCDRIVGPVGPDTNNELGVLVDGFDSPPFFMLAHNPRYYNELLMSIGYEKAHDFYSYFVSQESFIAEGKLSRVRSAILKRYPITLRTANIKKFDAELEIIGEIYNDAFAHHWGFVPMTSDEIRFFAGDLKLIVDPELVIIAECAGEPAGFLLGVPNINETLIKIKDGRLFPFGWLRFLVNKNKVKGVRVMTIGVKQKYQSLGLGSLFYSEIARRIVARGYTHAEMSWVAENNLMMNRAAELLGGRVYKAYRLYEKWL